MSALFLFSLSLLLCLPVHGNSEANLSILGGKKTKVENVHLAISSIASEMVVSWWTQHEASASLCYYGPGGVANLFASGDQNTYGGYHAGYNHNVKLTGLLPGTLYSYTCGDGVEMSANATFLTRASSVTSMTFAMYGDLGTEHGEDTVASITRRVANGDWEFICHLGDISYANDHLNYEGTWNDWFASLEEPLKAVPYMVGPGNHEKWSRDPVLSPDSNNFTAYQSKFRMPGEESGTNTSLFYSFDYGLVHFIMLNTESGYSGAPVDPEPVSDQTKNPFGYKYPNMANVDQEYYFQMNWLVDDLQKAVANRNNVPWIFVGGHRAIYEINDQRKGSPYSTAKTLQQWLEPLFIQYNVDVYFAGHVHHYSRNWPVKNDVVVQTNYVNTQATTYLVPGYAGNIEGHSAIDTTFTPTWYAFGDDTHFGYGEVMIYNATHLRWRAYAAGTDDILDEITLSRSR